MKENSEQNVTPSVNSISILYGLVVGVFAPIVIGLVTVLPLAGLMSSITGLTLEVVLEQWIFLFLTAVTNLLGMMMAGYVAARHAGYQQVRHALWVSVITVFFFAPAIGFGLQKSFSDGFNPTEFAHVLAFLSVVPFAYIGGLCAKRLAGHTNANHRLQPIMEVVRRFYDPRAAGRGVANTTITRSEYAFHILFFVGMLLLLTLDYFDGFRNVVFPNQGLFITYVVLDVLFLTVMLLMPFLMKVSSFADSKKYFRHIIVINTPSFVIAMVFIFAMQLTVAIARGDWEIPSEPERFVYDPVIAGIGALGYATYLHMQYWGLWTAREICQKNNY